MTDDEISRFFSEEDVKFPDWPAGTEVVCYCRSTDSRDAIEQIAQLYKPGQVMFAKCEAVEWKRDSTMPSYEEWRNQMLGGLRPSDWDKFIVR